MSLLLFAIFSHREIHEVNLDKPSDLVIEDVLVKRRLILIMFKKEELSLYNSNSYLDIEYAEVLASQINLRKYVTVFHSHISEFSVFS